MAVGNDQMRPCGFVAALRLIESTFFRVMIGTGLQQHDRAGFAFIPQVEPVIGIADGTLAEDGFVEPFHGTGHQILTDPAAIFPMGFIGGFGEAVDRVPKQNDPAVMVDHSLVGVKFFDIEMTVV